MGKIVYKIGADPELFVQHTATGSFLSAHNLVPGSKHSPYTVSDGAIQPDGTAAEFNIAPATTSKEFMKNMQSVMSQLLEEVQAGATKAGIVGPVNLKVQPTTFFEVTYFKNLPAEALAFGCTPDWNAWTQQQTEFSGTDLPFRTGAGHIHIGWTNDEDPYEDGHWDDCVNAVKQLDASMYFYSLLWDSDQSRRKLYGKMGAFRPKHYGVEYRPLSNAWVADPELHKFVFLTAKTAMERHDLEDVQFYKDTNAIRMLGKVHDHPNYVFSRPELLDYYGRTSADWGLPDLPDRYLKEVL